MRTTADRPRSLAFLPESPSGQARISPVPLAIVVMASLGPLLAALFLEANGSPLGLPGPSLHTLLGSASASAAVAVTILAAARFVVLRDPVAAVVASVMLLSFPLESIHALAEIGQARTADRTLWTWTFTRLFVALSMTAGLALLEVGGGSSRKARRSTVLVWCLGAAAIASTLTIWLRSDLPQALFPDEVVKRPWELPALVLFAVGALFVFPRLYRRQPSMLSHAIVLAAVPLMIGQLQLSLLSRDLYDPQFFSAHLQVFVAHAVILLGLVLDYVQVQSRAATTSNDLIAAQEKLRAETQKVELARLALTREHEARQRIEEAQLMLQKAVETASFGVTVTDLEGRIVYVNRADAEMHGFRPQELMGKDARLYGLGDLAAPRNGPLPIRFWDRESMNVRRDGSRFPVRLISDQVINPEGEPVGLLTICEDISTRREVERIRQDFLSTVSHELRTPLTSIVASLSLLESDELRPGPERARELSSIAFRNSNRLLKLIDDLLDLQKLKAEKMKFHLEPLDVRSLLRSAVEEIRSFADSREVSLEMSEELAGATIVADRDRMLQVFANLLSNAIKYSKPDNGSKIEISVRGQGESVCVSVADQGPGIPEDRLSNLFVPFSQVELAPAERHQGTGLGLSIVKRLLEGMNGAITVESRVGVGTTFHVLMQRAEQEKAP